MRVEANRGMLFCVRFFALFLAQKRHFPKSLNDRCARLPFTHAAQEPSRLPQAHRRG